MKFLQLLIVIVYVVFFLPVTIHSHHQLGLPHYLYSKDYPQIPTMVIDADAEGYTVTFSIFPGNPMPGQTVRIKTYIKHNITKKAYTKPIIMSVSRDTFFGGENEIVKPKNIRSEYNEYKMSYEFNEAEKFLINVTFEPRSDFFEKIPFPIVIGRTNFSFLPIFFGILFLGLFIIVGLTNKNKAKAAV
ncbi:MAG: hypothetical protein GY863_11530 [bacterium]|nr:hypothetical protein [bacterium]